MKDKTKKIDIKEFREKGYLQELNRQFLHPLGLALEVIKEDNGGERLGGVWDYRKDDEGIVYDINNKNSLSIQRDRINYFRKKAKYVNAVIKKRKPIREKILGFWIEPVPKEEIK